MTENTGYWPLLRRVVIRWWDKCFSDQNISAKNDQNISAKKTVWVDHWWNAEWLENTTRLRTFIPGIHHPGMTFTRTAWVRLNRAHNGVRCFRSCLDKWGMSLLRPVSVAQKTSCWACCTSSVQSIDLPVERMAWLFWMTRKSNGCSKPATRSSVAKQWIITLAQTIRRI